ncbi:DAK2 domain-containing protein [Paenibacillus sp. TRM 82003]|nr:DAK2 domain-containing protein [Paenibacillus sp. TRM 82003]
MSKRFINGTEFASMALAAGARLTANVQQVNALNVFPVPDGDTGTNMNLTLTSGVDELKRRPSEKVGQAAEVLAKGLLMGARGNSGVILSQLFRGFSKSVAGLEQIGPAEFASALQQGVETAYAAVVRPVEGTILTVSKDAAKAAVQSARRAPDIDTVMRDTLAAAKESLARTPDLLPVLKQVGVVDSGGQGLVYVYEGFYSALTNEAPAADAPSAAGAPKTDYSVFPPESMEEARRAKEAHAPVQAHIDVDSIEHGYCTEFIVRLTPGGKVPGLSFEEAAFREKLGDMGDSLLVVADDDLVKIHIHAEHPGEVMTYAQQFGDLTRIKIENMREQHSHILSQEYEDGDAAESVSDEPAVVAEEPLKPFGMIAVAAGEGLGDIFTSLGVDYVLSGGQTMNPSTEDILKAIEAVPAERVLVMPNNSNIVMAATQAKEIADKDVIVVPTKTIQQGIAAVLAFQETADFERNGAAMEQAAKRVKSGQVTFAVRDTSIDGVEIKEGDYIGILDGKIVVSEPDAYEACASLLRAMMDTGEEIVSVIVGDSAEEAVTNRIQAFFAESYPDAEVELLPGGQPVYTYLFSAE